VILSLIVQDTNRNLRAVDKMLERYKDIGEQKAAVVHAVSMHMFSIFGYYHLCNIKSN